ncbi:MAG: 3-deoxy-8-phosphooctulonate synthase [Candidatus Puniceispirillales bacterium]
MTTQHHISIDGIPIGNDLPMVLIAGPCAIESLEHAIDMAAALDRMAKELGIGFIYKSSFDKANRTSIHSHRGSGIDQGLAILAEVKKQIGCPVLTDIHLPEQCEDVAAVVDVMQIPAFLCRQTDLLIAAARTGKAVNVKKGQFLAPWDMEHVVSKIADAGNNNILITERGTSFGYNTLVTDMRGLPQMAATGYPVIFDATHSVQQPGGLGGASGGQRQFVPTLSRAAVAIGVAGVFMETHQQPDKAPSDGPNMIPLDHMPALIKTLLDFDHLAKAHGDSSIIV